MRTAVIVTIFKYKHIFSHKMPNLDELVMKYIFISNNNFIQLFNS
jgi:hypothetical protein